MSKEPEHWCPNCLTTRLIKMRLTFGANNNRGSANSMQQAPASTWDCASVGGCNGAFTDGFLQRMQSVTSRLIGMIDGNVAKPDPKDQAIENFNEDQKYTEPVRKVRLEGSDDEPEP